jgi:CubicO group peptidase (beta-lactamase class C family)
MTDGELGDVLGRHASTHGVPGAVAGILENGVATVACLGVADTRTGEPVTEDSRFGVGSLTKSMCATVVVELAEKGRLRLDDPVAVRVPELRGAAWAERATVRDLLANRSGIPLRASFEFDFTAHERDRGGGLLSSLATTIAAEEPTAVDWSYTNAGWCLVGRVIETVTGSAWEDALRAHLLTPAGMRDTAFASDAGPTARVSGHEPAPSGRMPVKPLVARAYGPAGTSLVSTAGDLLRFASRHLADPALSQMRAPQTGPAIHAWFDGWCLGWARFDWESGRVWGWDSVLPGERAMLRLLPEHDAAVVLLTNCDAGRAFCRAVLRELLQERFGSAVPTLRLEPEAGAAGDLSRFEGAYGWADRRVDVTAAGTHLIVTSEDGGHEARPVDGSTFVVDPADPDTPTVTFAAFDAEGRPNALYLMLWGLPRLGG